MDKPLDFAAIVKAAGADKPKQSHPTHVNHVGYAILTWNGTSWNIDHQFSNLNDNPPFVVVKAAFDAFKLNPDLSKIVAIVECE